MTCPLCPRPIDGVDYCAVHFEEQYTCRICLWPHSTCEHNVYVTKPFDATKCQSPICDNDIDPPLNTLCLPCFTAKASFFDIYQRVPDKLLLNNIDRCCYCLKLGLQGIALVKEVVSRNATTTTEKLFGCYSCVMQRLSAEVLRHINDDDVAKVVSNYIWPLIGVADLETDFKNGLYRFPDGKVIEMGMAMSRMQGF